MAVLALVLMAAAFPFLDGRTAANVTIGLRATGAEALLGHADTAMKVGRRSGRVEYDAPALAELAAQQLAEAGPDLSAWINQDPDCGAVVFRTTSGTVQGVAVLANRRDSAALEAWMDLPQILRGFAMQVGHDLEQGGSVDNFWATIGKSLVAAPPNPRFRAWFIEAGFPWTVVFIGFPPSHLGGDLLSAARLEQLIRQETED